MKLRIRGVFLKWKSIFRNSEVSKVWAELFKGSCNVGGPSHSIVLMFCFLNLASQKTAERNRRDRFEMVAMVMPYRQELANCLPLPSTPIAAPKNQTGSLTLFSLWIWRGASKATSHGVLMVKRVFWCTTRNVTNSCCYSQIQDSLCLDCHREKFKPRVPPACHALSKPLQRHLVAR